MAVVGAIAPAVPPEVLARASAWPEMKRWARRELAIELRGFGLSYNEIAAIVPVSRGTLSLWCRDVVMSAEQSARLREKRPQLEVRRAVGARRRRATAERTTALKEHARMEARALRSDSFWVAGVIAYWCEGGKRVNEIRFANSDPDLVTLFIAWSRRYLDVAVEDFGAKLHLHTGQDESERKNYWSDLTGIPAWRFGKTYIKQEGTGHRKNVLYQGTITIRIARSGGMLTRVLGWIDGLRDMGSTTIIPARAASSIGRAGAS